MRAKSAVLLTKDVLKTTTEDLLPSLTAMAPAVLFEWRP